MRQLIRQGFIELSGQAIQRLQIQIRSREIDQFFRGSQT